MAKNVLFYASVDGDRKFGAEEFKMWLGPFFKTGVFNGGLKVKANGSMVLTLEPGHANYQFGPVVEYDEAEYIAVPPAGSLPRIDRVVMRRDDPARDVYRHYLRGASSSNPVPPEITRGNGIYDLVLAQIPVNPGAVGITPDIVSDKREDPDLCGYVVATVEEIDFSGMWEQWVVLVKNLEDALEGVLDGTQYMTKLQYDQEGGARQMAFKSYPDDLETEDKTVPGAINELHNRFDGEDWKPLPFLGAFKGSLSYRKTPTGEIMLNGEVVIGAGNAGQMSTMGILPEGYRPQMRSWGAGTIWGYGTNTVKTFCGILVNPTNGAVQLSIGANVTGNNTLTMSMVMY